MRYQVHVSQIRVRSSEEDHSQDDEQSGGFGPKKTTRGPGSKAVSVDRGCHPKCEKDDVAYEYANQNVRLNERLQ